ncbi:MAG: 3'(2'),5'-bisphosphate nucleotidase CysQ, partial [Desulfatitalea sp.]|nr:3'(2'),5'-bisphosphate nucleotidase CysQ [Desulfatitalea sp.]NNK00982.1 3'(2'),5'-bisphosphate nucleotidase CysQ [Desulfatitalea sp.]
MNCRTLLVDAVQAAVQAGEAILNVYHTDFQVETKADHSPLTQADKQAHDIIKARLQRHNLPAISEEGRNIDSEVRRAWTTLWIVDPLDGTKEFVKKNGEFTVNIALVEGQRPVMGVIYAPVLDWLYFATADMGAYKIEGLRPGAVRSRLLPQHADDMDAFTAAAEKLPLPQPSPRSYTIVGSRSHGTPELEQFVDRKKEEKGDVAFSIAGSSLKICLVAEGAADIYPRLGPT